MTKKEMASEQENVNDITYNIVKLIIAMAKTIPKGLSSTKYERPTNSMEYDAISQICTAMYKNHLPPDAVMSGKWEDIWSWISLAEQKFAIFGIVPSTRPYIKYGEYIMKIKEDKTKLFVIMP
jgi:hypothetical protein